MNISTNYFMNSFTRNSVSSSTRTKNSFAFALDSIINKNEKTSFTSPIVSKEGIFTEEQLEYFKDTYDINNSTDYETKKAMLEDLKIFGTISEEDYQFMLSCVEQAHTELGSLSYAPILPLLDKYGNSVTKDTLPEDKISSFTGTLRKVEDWELYNHDNWSEELTYLSNLFSKRYSNFPEYQPYAEKFSKIADILNVIFD